MQTSRVFGLTGGIASGKSTALEAFAQLGVDTIDADHIARAVVAPGSAGAEALRTAIGDQYFKDDALDRSALRAALYGDPVLKQTVESIIHPRVKIALDRWKAEPSEAPYKILCSPLLFESGQHASLDGVIVIDVPPELQVSRASLRDAQRPEAIQAIIDQQLDRTRRLAQATHILNNDGTPDELIQQVIALDKVLRRD